MAGMGFCDDGDMAGSNDWSCLSLKALLLEMGTDDTERKKKKQRRYGEAGSYS